MTLFLLASAGGAGAATIPAKPLDLSAAVKYALDHSTTIAQRRLTVAQDEATFAKQHATEYPAITATLENQMQRTQNEQGVYAQYGLSPASTFSQNTAQIGANWTIFNGSAAQIQAQEDKRTLEAARFDLRRAEQQLAGDVTAAYYGLSAKAETVRLDASDRAYQGALLDAARAQERVGRVAAVDVLRAQVSALRSDTTLATARNDEANAREALSQQIGASPDTTYAASPAIPEPRIPSASLATMVAIARENRSDVASARANLAYARLTNSAIDTDRLPVFQISGAFGNQFTPTIVPATSFPRIGLATPIARGNSGFWQLGATETLSLPLIEYGARKAAHASARTAIATALQTLQNTENAVETDIRAALRNAQTAAENLQTSKQAADLGAESARIAQLQYRNGLISLTDATAAEQSALQAATDLVNARVNYVSAVVRLRVAVGTDDPLTTVEMSTP